MVITATRSQTDLKKLPAQVRTLDSEEMRERQVRTLPEALRELPGVNVQKTSNGQGSPYIRGFTGFRNLALIEVPHLFPANTTHLAVRRGTYLRSYAHAFIEKVCPDIGDEVVRAAIRQAIVQEA